MKGNYGEIMKFLLSVIAVCLVMIMKEFRVDALISFSANESL